MFAEARARLNESTGLSTAGHNVRSRLIADHLLVPAGDGYRLSRDHLFTSPSTAALVLLGTNLNGRTAWKDSAGKTLKEHQASASEAASA